RQSLALLERLLARGEPPPAALTGLQEALRADAAENLLVNAIRGERGGWDRFYDNWRAGNCSIIDLSGKLGTSSLERWWADRTREPKARIQYVQLWATT